MKKPTLALLTCLIIFSPSIAFGKDISGSVWRFNYDNDSAEQIILFEKDKTFTYQLVVSNSGNQGKVFSDERNTWTVNGNLVVLSYNFGYAILSLTINGSGDRMTGIFKNKKGTVCQVKGQLEEEVIFENGIFHNRDDDNNNEDDIPF
mgnify:CR=1 FL=1